MHKLQKRKQNFMHKHTVKTYNKMTCSVPSLLVVFVSRDFPMIPLQRPPGGGVLPYIGDIGMCGPKGYGFSAVLVINRVSILADLGHKLDMVFVLLH